MDKRIICSILMLIVLLLGACSSRPETEDAENIDSVGGSITEMLNKEDEGKMATARLEQIIEAI